MLATCAQKLSMNKHDLEERVAISASPGTCFNYYPEPDTSEDGHGSEPAWKLVFGRDDACWTTKDPATASPQELKKYFRYALSKKDKEAGKTESDRRFNMKYKTLRYKAGIHAVINGFTCRFASQFAYFTQEGWVSSCPKDTLGEPSLDNIYSERRMMRMLNNEKTDADKRPKVPTTLNKSLMKHVPSVFDGKPQIDLTGTIVEPKTPEKAKQEKKEKKEVLAKVERTPDTNPNSKLFTKTQVGDDPIAEEVEYLLYSIDCDGDREDAFLGVGNFMKFSCTFRERKQMFEEWADGGWQRPDGTMTNTHERGSRPGWWNAEKKPLGLDIGYLRHLARQTDWGLRRLAEYDNKSLIKSVLGLEKTDFAYEPQFGQADVARMVKDMMPPLLYDDMNKPTNEGLFCWDEVTGIWSEVSKLWIKRFIITKVWWFLERQLIPEVAKRGELIKEIKDLQREHEFLMGVYKAKKSKGGEVEMKLVTKGLIHKLKEQLSSLHNDAPQVNVANSLQTQSGFKADPYFLPEMWNNK
eukprot:SAG22_NODE_4_length_44774_cov_362.122149_58_plen_524_part_01